MNKILNLTIINLVSLFIALGIGHYLVRYEWFSKGEALVVFFVVFILMRNTIYLEEIMIKIEESF